MRNTIASLIMLSAALTAVLCCIFMDYTLENTLIVLVTVLFIFMIIGFIAQRKINKMTEEAEERIRKEEEARQEAERLELERLEQERLELERLEQENAEADSQITDVTSQNIPKQETANQI